MENKKILEKISEYRKTRETFWINDKNWFGRCKVIIIGVIVSNTIKEDMVTLIDMWEYSESTSVIDYNISLTDLINSIKEFEANEKEAIDKFNS